MTVVIVGVVVALLLSFGVICLLVYLQEAAQDRRAARLLWVEQQRLRGALELSEIQRATERALHEEAWRQRSLG